MCPPLLWLVLPTTRLQNTGKGSFIIYEVGGGGIYTKVVANVANHLDKTYVMVHDDECEGKN